jgi:ubiquinone/menaquinone biosynthesis C-methylase UbiE
MRKDSYPLGYTMPMVKFLSHRTAETHAAFFLPRLERGWRVLDAGCGPGTITRGLARAVHPGIVTGVDVEESQFGGAGIQGEHDACLVEFRKASVYELPFKDQTFDAVFAHGVLEHLTDPETALVELRRVLKIGGLIGVRAADLGGLLLDGGKALARAFSAYLANQKNDAKDPNFGHTLGRLLRQAGFTVQALTASYDVVSEEIQNVGTNPEHQPEAPSSPSRDEKSDDNYLFVALAWCEAVASNEAGVKGEMTEHSR